MPTDRRLRTKEAPVAAVQNEEKPKKRTINRQGFDEVYLHNVGRNQEEFIRAYGERVIPKLRWPEKG